MRRCAMYSIAMAYCGSGNNEAIRKLLHVAVSDVNDDVRRAAVEALGFILFRYERIWPNTIGWNYFSKKLDIEEHQNSVQVLFHCCLKVTIHMCDTVQPWHLVLLVLAQETRFISSQQSIKNWVNLFEFATFQGSTSRIGADVERRRQLRTTRCSRCHEPCLHTAYGSNMPQSENTPWNSHENNYGQARWRHCKIRCHHCTWYFRCR